jgi:hypothetical protein
MPQPPVNRRNPRQAVYAPRQDCVYIPDLDQFETAEQYYATLFHKIATDQGAIWVRIVIATDQGAIWVRIVIARPAPIRAGVCPLGTPTPFGTPDYSKEEIVD